MNKIINMKMGKLLYVIMGLMLLELIVVAVVGGNLMQRNEKVGQSLYDNYGKAQADLAMGYAKFQDEKELCRNYLYVFANDSENQAAAKAGFAEAQKELEKYFAAGREELIEQDVLKLLDELDGYMDKYNEDINTCVSYVEEGKLGEARQYFLSTAIVSEDAVDERIGGVIDALDSYAGNAYTNLTTTNSRGLLIIAALIVLSILSCWNSVRILCKRIRNPIVEITQVAQKVAKGEVDQKLDKTDMTNEVGILQNSFHDMIENFKMQAAVLAELANGNYNVSIQPQSGKDLMGNALARLVNDDNKTFGVIRNATDQISLGSSQIAAASQTLAQGSTEQASSIEQIAASITNIANKTKDNAEQAGEVNRIVLDARNDVEAGNERMQEMVAAMQEINESSENIQKIIKVIDDIAFNTNILALNATVEAARAGEQGKGFAVVAEEVRNLAGRSAEASSQTAEMIEDSIRKVKRGSELAVETAKALELISKMIEDISGLSKEIADASNVQASDTAQIDQALSQVSQVVQTNSATSQQCASASEQLSGQAHGLEKELSRFQLKDVIGNMPSQSLEYAEPMMLGDNASRY